MNILSLHNIYYIIALFFFIFFLVEATPCRKQSIPDHQNKTVDCIEETVLQELNIFHNVFKDIADSVKFNLLTSQIRSIQAY
ncbi:hypothetical protein K1T71_000204 [Dendrolimus kikuchii]|uniref:Uncharacterized protein n=1 Tax=Dendrolimus kikuchii TaxID=765133 RepID=A0ACC1DK78_9NEOP|nr:hypothetical protein K1T71_000204 [Dendrolimus kikuchii]